MRSLLAAVLLFVCACGTPSSSPPRELAADPAETLRAIPLSDLQFSDQQLQEIATSVVREARARGIETVSGRHRIDGLLRLEATLGRPPAALERVNSLASLLTAADIGPWAELRRRAALEFDARDDDASRRVQELLSRWQREKAEVALRYLSSNYRRFISSAEWERRFHEFVSQRPADAATWGWLVLRHRPEETRQRYGKADAETAYRFYLVTGGFGTADDARRTFSVPGIELEAAAER